MKRKILVFFIAIIVIGMLVIPASAKQVNPPRGLNIWDAHGIWDAVMNLQQQINEIQLTPGPIGPIGPIGPTGAPGADGLAGADGKDGVDGLAGADGKDGVDGLAGADGKDGVDGLAGVDGKDGVDGLAGVDGKDGADGLAGVDGKDGVDGLAGVAGTNGVSGYEIVPGTPSGDIDGARTVTATCLNGKKVVGGGFLVSSIASSAEVAIYASYPSSNTVWTVSGTVDNPNAPTTNYVLTAYAICVSAL